MLNLTLKDVRTAGGLSYPVVSADIAGLAENLSADNALIHLPELSAHLRTYSLFRKRDVELLHTLRNRGVAWCRERRLGDVEVDRILAGSVVMAYGFGAAESKAMAALRSFGVQHAVREAGRLNTGLSFTGGETSVANWLRGRSTLTDVWEGWRRWWHSPTLALAPR